MFISDLYEFFVSGSIVLLFIIKASTARASPVVILVNFLTLPLSVAASVLKTYPVVSSVADFTDVHVTKGRHICFRSKAKVIEINLAACALDGRAAFGGVLFYV